MTILSSWWRRVMVCPDSYAGYEVRVWYIFWPFWKQVDGVNTHQNREGAIAWADAYFNRQKDII